MFMGIVFQYTFFNRILYESYHFITICIKINFFNFSHKILKFTVCTHKEAKTNTWIKLLHLKGSWLVTMELTWSNIFILAVYIIDLTLYEMRVQVNQSFSVFDLI